MTDFMNQSSRLAGGSRMRAWNWVTTVSTLLMASASPSLSYCQLTDPKTKVDSTEKQTPVKAQQKLARDSAELPDRLVMLAVEDKLRRSEAVNGHVFNVDVDDGIVTISGRLNNILAERIAVGLAGRVRGVKSVVDQIEIVVERRNNADLTKDVLAAIKADPATHELELTVKAEDGIVTLAGTVPSNGFKSLAGEVAMGVKGVADIKSDLQIKSTKPLSDETLRQEIRELFRFNALLDDVEIDVVVKDAKVVLNGDVASTYQKSYAEELAMLAGAKAVDTRGINVSWRHANPLLRRQRYEDASDDEIRSAIQRAFQHDPRVLSFKLEVQVDHGTVTLTGEVSHLTARTAAERDVRQTIGVRRVKNNLQVRWPTESPSDEVIATFTREALARDPYVEKNDIVVECGDAHVSLYGVVDTPFEKEHAVWTTSRQKGVVHVNDYLAVRPKWVPKSDDEIQADLNEKLAYAFIEPENQVTAKVVDGVAILQGTVDTWMMWQTAIDQAIAAGARRPHNTIEVRYGLPSGPHYYGPHNYVPR